METFLQHTQDIVTEYGFSILAAIAIFFIGKWAARFITNTLKRLMLRAKVDPTLISFGSNLAYAALMVFVVLATLNQLGIQTTSFIAILGAAGLAIGLAMQDSLSNFSAGVMMIIFRPFKTGDYIEAAGTAGTVMDLNIFTTRLKTGDNRVIFVPNSKIMSDSITNYSANDTRRIDMVFGIGYDDDIRQAKAIIEEVLKADERIFDDPAPTIGVLELADSSVNLAVRPWVKSSDFGATKFDLNETIKIRFDEAGITIPYPQTDIHVNQKSPD